MPKKILIVDDERHITLMVGSRLKANGYEVVVAVDGEEGLAKARAEQPDLILLDIMMPRMNGYQVCAELKQDEKNKNIPIILFSAKAEEESKRMGLEECGANGYLVKPFEAKALLDKLAEFL